jgi:hypothetical protein
MVTQRKDLHARQPILISALSRDPMATSKRAYFPLSPSLLVLYVVLQIGGATPYLARSFLFAVDGHLGCGLQGCLTARAAGTGLGKAVRGLGLMVAMQITMMMGIGFVGPAHLKERMMQGC